MTASIFVDTNIFVYARDVASPQKHATSRRYRLSWWDAMIVAAANLQNCSTLYLRHGR